MTLESTVWNAKTYYDLREYLFNLSENEYRKFHSGLCKSSSYPILGVRLPRLRTVAKVISKGDAVSFLKNTKPQSYEEVMIRGIVTATLKFPFSEKQDYIEDFLPYIDNWAVCDSFCSSLKPKTKDVPLLWDMVLKHLHSENEYSSRFSVVTMMDYYLTDEYIDSVLVCLDTVDCEKYYVSMAVAWALSFCYIKYHEKTLAYFKICKTDDLTFNRAMQKILDSHRVSDSEKDEIRKMKRTVER